MIKNTKRGIFILLVMLCITFAFVIGCGSIEMPGGGTGGGDKPIVKPPVTEKPQLSAVVASSVTFEETASTLIVTWDAVPNATSYYLRITKSTSSSAFAATVEEPTVDLRRLAGLTIPDNGSVTVRFTAQASGFTASENTEITYELEGTLLLSPEITSFDNGVIEWKSVADASSYTVKVNGSATETQTNKYNAGSLPDNAIVEISAKIGGRMGAVTKVKYNAATQKLSALPIIDYKMDGDILRWDEVGGAVGYKIVDLDFNTYTVTTPYYLMSMSNIVYGVYPVMSKKSLVASAEIASVDMKYLEGSGTQADPYLIKTAFDLRTIDYYELKSSEAGSSAKNYYKIANDIDYHTVSALDSESNMFTLRKPFFGVLDGDNHKLSNINVIYDNGFWALSEYIAVGGIVKNIKFDGVSINNGVQDETFPINPATAMIAYRNYGTVTEISLSNATFTVCAGSAAGIVIHNYGKVIGCTVHKCALKEGKTGLEAKEGDALAAYEMGGIVLENCKGGEVSGNTATNLTISGVIVTVYGKVYYNLGSAAGIVSINRKGGTVKDNSYDTVTMTNLRNDKEAGGVVAYCADSNDVVQGKGTLGKLTVNGSNVTAITGSGSPAKGKLYGKKG